MRGLLHFSISIYSIFPFTNGYIIDFCDFYPFACDQEKNLPESSSKEASNPFKIVDKIFVAPIIGSSEFAFHFNESYVGDWVLAKKYCIGLQSDLLEIYSSQDAHFIKSFIKFKGYKVNWWLGLRKTERCRCVDPISTNVANAILNPSDLGIGGIIATKCSVNTNKTCKNQYTPWIWSGSSNPPDSYQDWSKPGFSTKDHFCAILRGKEEEEEYSWQTEQCSRSKGLSGTPIAPICFKKIKTKEITEPFTPLEDLIQCFDINVIYRGSIIRESIQYVPNARRCSAICRLVKGCRYWTWRGDLIIRLCILKDKLRKNNFRVHLPGAVSGKILSCRASPDIKNGPCYMSYSTELIKSEIIQIDSGSLTSQDCKDKCKNLSDLCASFSWYEAFQTSHCVLSTSTIEDESSGFAYRLGGISGVFPRKECFYKSEDKSKCTCKSFDYEYYDQMDVLINEGNVAKGCKPPREFAFCPIANVTKSEGSSGLKLPQKDVCIEIGVNYNNARSVIDERSNIPSVDICRKLCVKKCKRWTWFQDSYACVLIGDGNKFSRIRNPNTISGNVLRSCSNKFNLSSFNLCSCLPLDKADEMKRKQKGQKIYSRLTKNKRFCLRGLIPKCGPLQINKKFVPKKLI